MKITRFLMAILVIVPFIQSCQDDITELDDPRDAITKLWRVTDNTPVGSNGYDVTIRRHPTEKTRILFDNFHALGTSDDLYATMAGYNLTIPSQTLDGTYTISGSGTIASNSETITFNYTVDAGDGPESITATFGQVVTTKKKKGKAAKQVQ